MVELSKLNRKSNGLCRQHPKGRRLLKPSKMECIDLRCNLRAPFCSGPKVIRSVHRQKRKRVGSASLVVKIAEENDDQYDDDIDQKTSDQFPEIVVVEWDSEKFHG